MQRRIGILFVLVSLAGSGCSENASVLSQKEIQAIQLVFDAAEQTPDVMEKWSRSCALCHVNGEGGAPRMGDASAWKPRIAKGNAQLMVNTVRGFNRMPPLGYCMDCEDNDFAAMIKMMAGIDK